MDLFFSFFFFFTIRFEDFAPMFKAELFDPDEWATLFKNAGAKCKKVNTPKFDLILSDFKPALFGWVTRNRLPLSLFFSPLHPYTHRTRRLVWVPWCDSRNRASRYQIEAASWQRRADRMRAECERHGERESERRREDRATKLGRTRKTIRCYQSEQ